MKLGVQMLVKHIAVMSGGIRALWMRPSERLEVRRNVARDGQEDWRVSEHRFRDARNGVSTRNGGESYELPGACVLARHAERRHDQSFFFGVGRFLKPRDGAKLEALLAWSFVS